MMIHFPKVLTKNHSNMMDNLENLLDNQIIIDSYANNLIPFNNHFLSFKLDDPTYLYIDMKGNPVHYNYLWSQGKRYIINDEDVTRVSTKYKIKKAVATNCFVLNKETHDIKVKIIERDDIFFSRYFHYLHEYKQNSYFTEFSNDNYFFVCVIKSHYPNPNYFENIYHFENKLNPEKNVIKIPNKRIFDVLDKNSKNNTLFDAGGFYPLEKIYRDYELNQRIIRKAFPKLFEITQSTQNNKDWTMFDFSS